MTKRFRQYLGLICAVLSYYIVHEGAHLICAIAFGVFKKINFMGLGMQIDVYADKMTDMQMGIFCLAGALATLVAALILVFLSGKVKSARSKTLKACLYYITIIMLVLDPVYLSVLCGFFGGGDMNGISLLIPELIARIIFGALLIINVIVFIKIVLPRYKEAFKE